MNNTFIHIPTPGDHYSAATGSAIPTIIYELSLQRQACGGKTSVIVGRDTRHDYDVGECIAVDFGPLPGKPQKLMDAGLGRIGLPRLFSPAVYRPASKAIDSRFDGAIFVWNNPAPIEMIKSHHKEAMVCLYAQNELFRTYSPAETRRVLSYADKVICCSNFIAGEINARMGAASAKVHAVNNGVNVERFAPAPTSPSADVPEILFIGRVLPIKGPDLLLRAAVKIADATRNFRVRIVGSSNFAAEAPLTAYEQELREIAAPIRDRVKFQPFVDRAGIVDEYHRAAFFCVPSNWDEPCSLTVPEALGCGLPTIAARRGGIPEVGGDAVLYFDPPNVDQLAERLVYLLEDEQARAAWGARARARAEAISWEIQYQKLCAALK